MKRKRLYTDYLRDIVYYTEKVEQFIAGIDFERFTANEEKTLAVIHAMQIIGEAVNHLPPSLKQRYPEVPWEDVIGMRNLIVHGYFMVDLEVVWRTAKKNLPPLHKVIARILEEIEGGKPDA